MQELEKILEEIEKEAICISSYYVSEKFRDKEDLYVPLSDVNNIIRKHMNDGWILVEERLPEYNESGFYDAVNVTMKNGSVTHGCYRNYDEEWWVASEDGEFKYTQSSEVIAWSPLPEPYHPERNDNHDGE